MCPIKLKEKKSVNSTCTHYLLYIHVQYIYTFLCTQRSMAGFFFHPQSIPSIALGVGGILNFVSQLFGALKARIAVLERLSIRVQERISQICSQQQTFLRFRSKTETNLREMWKRVDERNGKSEKQLIREKRMEQRMTVVESRVNKIEGRLDNIEQRMITRQRTLSATF